MANLGERYYDGNYKMTAIKQPPHSRDAEQSVLGALLLDDRAYSKVKAEVEHGDFYFTEHNQIYAEMQRMQTRGESLDVVTVSEALEDSGILDKVGGIAYLGELADMTPSTENAAAYAKIVKQRSFSRQVMAANIEFAEALSNHGNPIEATVSFREELASLVNPLHKNSSDLYSKLVFDAREAMDLEEPDYWIDGMLPKDSFSMVFGPSGQFKSFITMDMALCISTGMPYHGNDVEQSPVIYVTGEGARSINLRKRAWEIKHGRYANDMAILPMAVDMTDSAASVSLTLAVERFEHEKGNRPGLLIVDTLNRCYGDGDENSSQDMSRFVRSCDEFRAASGCDILVVHHSGKDVTKGARGSSVLRAALDTEFSVARIGEDMRGRNVTLSCTKIKDGAEPPDLTFCMKQVLLGKKNKKGHELDSLVAEMIENPSDNFGAREEQIFTDIVRALGNNAKVGIVLKEFKEAMPAGFDKSKAADLIKAIASNCNAYVMGGKYLLQGE